MAEDREEQYLKAIKDGKVVAVGEKGTKEVDVTGLTPNTKYAKGTYKKAFDATVDKNLSDIASDSVDVEEFTTLPITVTGVTLDKDTLSVEEGASSKLTATVTPTNATDKSVTWKSGNDATATVDQNGTVAGVKAGTVNVVATTKDGSKTATCAITVTAKPADTPTEG